MFAQDWHAMMLMMMGVVAGSRVGVYLGLSGNRLIEGEMPSLLMHCGCVTVTVNVRGWTLESADLLDYCCRTRHVANVVRPMM